MTEDLLNYPSLIDQAMRGVVRDVLRRVKATGLPGEHHFYISYDTTHPGVKMSDQLRARYPREITIVLQHQYWDFKVEENLFQVTLSFGGVPEKLTVPFAAMTAFADPSIKFGLQFQNPDMFDAEIMNAEQVQTISLEPDEAPNSSGAAEIISLDTFRKK